MVSFLLLRKTNTFFPAAPIFSFIQPVELLEANFVRMGRTSNKAAKKKAKKPDADVKIPPKREHDVMYEGIKETESEAKVCVKAEMEAKEKRERSRLW